MKSIKTEFPNVTEYYNEQGQLHREDGPAIIFSNGRKQWWINGKLHRVDGPAIEWSDGSKSWFLKGEKYSEQDWSHEITNIKLKRILDL
jgi:hypothetical protein